MIGVHGIPVGNRIEVKTIQVDMDNAYSIWKEKEGEAKADIRRAKFTEVESLPEEPAQVKGKRNVLYLDPKTKKLTYEQKDRPLSQEEVMADLATAITAQNTAMSAKLDQLITLQTEANKLAKGV